MGYSTLILYIYRQSRWNGGFSRQLLQMNFLLILILLVKSRCCPDYLPITQTTLFIVSPDLREEMRPDNLQDVSEVERFDTSKLKHVETKESNVLPTKEGNLQF